MNIMMIGMDHERTKIETRERLSFVSGQVEILLKKICEHAWISGAVLLSTCNRTELYVSYQDQLEEDPARVLCEAANVPYAIFESAFTVRKGDRAIQHLMKVACGLRSQILGEDQIVAQVKNAVRIAREAHAVDANLETLFRCAVTAGKEVKTEVRLTAVPLSAAHRAVELAESRLQPSEKKRAVVIGNGEMGRLASRLLVQRGWKVTVTLRSYRHREIIVPHGCMTQPYENRLESIADCDLVISATTSPHYTLTAEQIRDLDQRPALLIDLALPRDIDPRIQEEMGVLCFNMDDLGRYNEENQEERQAIDRIIQKQTTCFYEWQRYRESLPVIEELKRTAYRRVCTNHHYAALQQDGREAETTRLAVEKTIDMLLGGMKDVVSSAMLEQCLKKMYRKQT